MSHLLAGHDLVQKLSGHVYGQRRLEVLTTEYHQLSNLSH